MQEDLSALSDQLEGDLHYDSLMRTLYATDASVYRELPLAVALPKSSSDLRHIINFAHRHKTSLIPRAAGTSLAGQCVGEGIVVDMGRYMDQILEINPQEKWVRVQPGVIRDQLNEVLRPHGLFFGPNTSTANRCMIGGMVGNNACGSTSIIYGSTRDHVLELEAMLSDGSQATFTSLSSDEFQQKLNGNTLENKVYQQIHEALVQEEIQDEINKEFPRPAIKRRNTGFAVDLLLRQQPFHKKGEPFNFSTLLCGSEGTLALTLSVKLALSPLPPPVDILVCVHFNSIKEAMRAVLPIMETKPSACELMDQVILHCTKENPQHNRNRFFVAGDPKAILIIEYRAYQTDEAIKKAEKLIQILQKKNLGYAHPIVQSPATAQVWALRKAGLGLLSNVKGDKKPVACIEDTAVDIRDLPDYIDEFETMLSSFGQKAVYYAHAGAGELHLRPMLNLKAPADRQLFHDISEATAKLVKKYGGSLSGEHGDGRVRAPFLERMIGPRNYRLMEDIKGTWDPLGIFNPGKIINPKPITQDLRYEADPKEFTFSTFFDWSADGSILLATERCTGSGDCRKLPLSGGTMCPSYRATRNEKDSTRGRANILRECLTQSQEDNPFDSADLKEALDLCLSCKACATECPSTVDMTAMKAEFQYQYHKKHGIPRRTRAIANLTEINRMGITAPWLTNAVTQSKWGSHLIKKYLSVASERSLPRLSPFSLTAWYRRKKKRLTSKGPIKGNVFLYIDEFTNYQDAKMGRDAILLLTTLGYQVHVANLNQSGRVHLSKGLLEEARTFAEYNVKAMAQVLSSDTPLVGLEPSAILSFRDEYPRLVRSHLKKDAQRIAPLALTFEDFFYQEFQKGKINPYVFTEDQATVLVHSHCHQKAIDGPESTIFCLSIPRNYNVSFIPAGCCGMAGSFGYEKEHYELSQVIGEQTLFPAVREAAPDTILAASGTSCRHQIKDGTQRTALHPAQILYQALRPTKGIDPGKERNQIPTHSYPAQTP